MACFGAVILALLEAGCSRQDKKVQFLSRAERYFMAGQYDKAEADYLTVLRRDPENVAALKGLGVIWLDQGRVERAGPVVHHVQQLATNDLSLRLRMAAVLLTYGQYREARDDANFVLDRQPENEEAAVILAESAHRPDEVAAALARLRALSPAAAPRVNCEAAIAALSLRQNPPDLTAAGKSLQLALARNPPSPFALSVLGVLCLATNNLAGADQYLHQAAELSPPYSSRRLRYVQFKAQNHDLPGARQAAEALVKRTPDFLPAWIELARLQAAEQQFEEATMAVGKVLARDSQNLEAGLLGADIKLARGDAAGAVFDLEKIAPHYPKSVSIPFALARAASAAGDSAKTETALHLVLSLEPNNRPAQLALVQLDFQRGELNTGIFTLQRLVEKEPRLDAAWELLARGYRARGNLAEEAAVYSQLATNHPAEPGFALALGEVRVRQGQRVAARAAFEHALQLAPKYPGSLPALQELVELDLLEKAAPAAVGRVEQLLAEAPKAPEPRYLRAQIWLATHTAEGTNQAEIALQKAIELQPDYLPAVTRLVRLHHDSHQNEKALAELGRLTERNPRDLTVLMQIALIREEEKDYSGAAASYAAILKLNPKFTPALNNAACLYSEYLGDLDRAYSYATQARALLPADPRVADTLGWVRFHRGEYPGAFSLLQESAQKSARDPETQYHLGRVQYVLGHESAARTALQAARDLGLSAPARAEADKRLAVLTLDPAATNETSFQLLSQRLAEEPADLIALTRLGQLYATRTEWAPAVATYQKARTANPQYVPALLQLADLYAGPLTNLATALEFAQAAYKVSPDNAGVARLYGTLTYRNGDYTIALGLLFGAARQLPQDADLQFTIAQALYAQGETAAALSAARTALSLGAKGAPAVEIREFLELTDPATPPPAAVIDQALARQSNSLPALMARAAQAEQRAEPRVAVSLYTRVLAAHPKFGPAAKRLAGLAVAGADPATAKTAYPYGETALAARPQDTELVRLVGLLAFTQSNHERAVKLLQRLAGGPNEDAQTAYTLGLAQQDLHHNAESAVALRRALTLGLTGPDATTAQKILDALKQ